MRLLRVLTVLGALLAVGACMTPYRNVSPEVVNAFCGSQERYDAEFEEGQRRVDEGRSAIPTVGMPACTVVAWWGVPNDQTMVDVGDGPVAHWTYWIPVGTQGDKPHLVTVEAGPDGRGVVRSVVWH